MAPFVPPGEPRQSPKPQPIGNFPVVFLMTTGTLCLLFLLWRRANTLRSIVSHQLKTWSRPEGRIRLSEDNGPPSTEFLEDYDIEDNEEIDDDEPLAARAQRLKTLPTQVATVERIVDLNGGPGGRRDSQDLPA